MREQDGAAASTIRRRLAALSSLFTHLVQHSAAIRNPVVGWLSFAAGASSGVTKGEVAAQTINAAMAAGPGSAAVWPLLMANNDPVQALAACEKSVRVTSDGQHYCSMPVSLDRKMVPD
jgi:hypothetical protein